MNAPRPVAPDGLWLDDIAEGATFVTHTHAVDTAEILDFARRYDPQHTVNQHDEVRQIARPRILMWDRPNA